MGPPVAALQTMLARYGYGACGERGLRRGDGRRVAAFQRHFRPAQVDGVADVSTIETLRALTLPCRAPPEPVSPRRQAGESHEQIGLGDQAEHAAVGVDDRDLMGGAGGQRRTRVRAFSSARR